MSEHNEQRIYVAVAGTIQVPVNPGSHKPPLRTVIQPAGRQIAQACHVVSKLRHGTEIWGCRLTGNHCDSLGPGGFLGHTCGKIEFEPITTIILQARDSAEMYHVHYLLVRKKLKPVIFSDTNPEYGPGDWPTAVAVFATKKQVQGALDYLPLWGPK